MCPHRSLYYRASLPRHRWFPSLKMHHQEGKCLEVLEQCQSCVSLCHLNMAPWPRVLSSERKRWELQAGGGGIRGRGGAGQSCLSGQKRPPPRCAVLSLPAETSWSRLLPLVGPGLCVLQQHHPSPFLSAHGKLIS